MRFSILAISALLSTNPSFTVAQQVDAIDDYIHTDLNQQIYIPVLDNDVKAESNMPLSVRQIITNAVDGVNNLHNAQNGVCDVAPNHFGVIYTPNANYNGYDYCTYEACDGRGPPHCDTAEITIHVGPHNDSEAPTVTPMPTDFPTASPTVFISPSAVNTMPIARNDEATLANNEQVTVNVLKNDSRGDPNLPLSVRQVITNETENNTPSVNTLHNALNGVCEVSEDHLSVTYTPNAGFVGSDSCQYQACDGRGPPFCDTAHITFTVTAAPTPNPTRNPTPSPTPNPTTAPTVNPANVPVANDDSRTMTNTVPTSTLRINVLVNDDRGNAAFPLSVQSIITDADNEADNTNFPIALNGICTISQDHLAVNYTPNVGFDGVDRCAYRMCDSRGEPYCDTAIVQVTVNAPTPSSPTNIPTRNPTMMPTNSPTVSEEPTISPKPTRSPTNSPTPENNMPVAVKDTVTLQVNEVVRVPVLQNDILGDADFAPLRVLQIVQNDFNALHNALNGVCIVSEDRLAVVYTPNVDFDGVDRCTYEMCDSRGEPCEYIYILLDVVC